MPFRSSGSRALCWLLGAIAAPAMAQLSPNDSCTNPLVIDNAFGTPVTISYNNAAATTGPQGQNNALCNYAGTPGIQNDQWYVWVATGTGMATLTACGVPAGDTKVAVYYSDWFYATTCPADSDIIACNDDFCSLRSQITFYVAAGNRYTIQIGKYPGSGNGAGIFILTPPLTRGGDDCAAPTIIAGALVGLTFENATRTTGSQGQNNAACNFAGQMGIQNDEWFLWTAPGTGSALLTTCFNFGGANADSKVAVYETSSCPAPNTAIACNDDSCGLASELAFQAVCGHQYLIQIGKYPGSGNGAGTFKLDLATAPNSECTCPTTVTGSSANLPFSFAPHIGRQGASADICGAGPPGIDYSVWYRWVAIGNGNATITGCGLGNTSDTKIAVYRGCPSSPGTAVACNDNSCGLQSAVTFPVVHQTEYLIQIGRSTNSNSSFGAGTFTLTGPPPAVPPNDACAAATAISGSGMVPFDTAWASADGDGECGVSAQTPDVWFRYTSGAAAWVQFDTCSGTSFNTVVSAHSACGGAVLDCNDNFCGVQSAIVVHVNAGVPILVRVSGSRGAAGAGMLTFTSTLSPANDDCASAAALPAVGNVPFSTVNASNEPGNSAGACGGSDLSRDVWFSYQPPFNGAAFFGLCGLTCGTANFDTVLEVYTGCPSAGGVRVGCSDDACDGNQAAVLLPVYTNTTYRIRVAGHSGQIGSGTLAWSVGGGCLFLPPCPFAEPEPCGSDTNYDCPAVTPISDGQTVLGTLSTSDRADTYRMTIASESILTWRGVGQMPFRLQVRNGFCNDVPGGRADGPACTEISCWARLLPGTYHLTAAINSFADVSCGGGSNYYWAHVSLAPVPPPPPNDNCTSATAISGSGTVPFDTTGATGAWSSNCPGDIGDISPDVWFSYTPTSTGTVLFDTCAGATFFRFLSAFAVCNTVEIACGHCDLTVPVTAGVPVLLRISGENYAVGSGTLTYTFTPPPVPPNDLCSNAPTITGSGFVDFDSTGATPDGSASCGVQPSPDIWFRYNPAATGRASFDTCTQTAMDTVLSARTACPPGGAELACNDNACGLQSRLTVPVTAGTPVLVRLGGQAGPGRLTYAFSAPPEDWNHDGVINSQDFFDFVTAFFGPQGADFNHDGATNSQDLFDFLNCFFNGC